jgi:hypothetical protein
MDDDGAPMSAARLANQLGDELLAPADVPPEALDLVGAVRDLTDAVVTTDVPPAERAAVAADVRALAARLRAARLAPLVAIARHADGRVENLLQAGSGRLNPHAPAVEFADLPAPPPPGADPVAVEVVAHCTLGERYGGPPGRAHGGVVAALLDEVVGVAAYVAGATGMTAGLEVRYRRATPLGVPLTITARWVQRDGRKSRATGEVRAGDAVTADATAVLVDQIP